MKPLLCLLGLFALFITPLATTFAQDDPTAKSADADEFSIEQPYGGLQQVTDTTERFILFELRDLRREIEKQKYEVIQEVVERQYANMDRTLSYTSGIINFFWFVISVITFLIAIFTTLGWRSLGDIKSSTKNMIENQAKELLKNSQDRLLKIETDLKHKEEEISKHHEELQRMQQLNTLWLQVNRERDDRKRLEMLDQILELEDGVDAYVMKAGSYIRLRIAEKAIEMADIALEMIPDQALAHYHRACAYALMQKKDETLADLNHAFKIAPSFRDGIEDESIFDSLKNDKDFKRVVAGES